jgi:pSer/pThr/pTyr-binding forkhead associated (FHA) protein
MQSWLIGSDAGCDVVVDSSVVSARHCRLTEAAGGYILEDLGSTNGTYVNGSRISAACQVATKDVITLGLNVRMPWPGKASARGTVILHIGREPDNDYVVDLPTVSGHHARVIWNGEPGEALIEDLGSSNGTALGAPHQRITRSPFMASDTIYLGTHAIPGAEILARLAGSRVPTLTFRGQSMLVGRDTSCDLVVDRPMISGCHAQLARRDGQIVIKDLGSSNGTFVNSQRIDRETPIRDGDLIGLGSYSLILAVEAPHSFNLLAEKEVSREPGAAQPPPRVVGPRFPVIRVKRRLFRFEVTAVYASYILTGSRWRRSVPITEEMCQPSGEPELAILLSGRRQLDFADVEEVREETTKKPRKWWIFNLPATTRESRFAIKGGNRRQIHLTIPTSQSTSVRAALLASLGDRYQVRNLKRPGLGMPLLLGLLSLLVSLTALVAFANEARVLGITEAAFAFLLLVTAFWYVLAPRGAWRPVDANWPDGPADAQPQIKRKNKKRNPFRSQRLGWTLKLVGIAYFIVVASPLTDRLNDLLDSSKVNYQARSNFWALVYAPAAILIYCGYRLCQRRYEPAARSDLRKPILFLRPFEDDAQTTLQPRGWIASISGIRADSTSWGQNAGGLDKPSAGRFTVKSLALNANPIRLFRMVIDYGVETSEELLVRYFETFGPVIAIGKPGERLSTPGSARMYVDDDHWQQAILTELNRAQAVVIQPGTSAGVHWELEQIRARVEPYRVLLCLVSYWNDPQAYEDLAALLGRIFRVEVPRVVPYLDRPCFLYFERGWQSRLQELSYKNPISWPVTGNAADLTYTLHPFLQGMHGGDREFPREPRWKSGLGKQVSLATALCLAIVVAVVPPLIVHFVGAVAGALFAGRPSAGDTSPNESSSTPIAGGQQIPDVVSAPRITLSGRAVPYRFEVPQSFLKTETTETLIEHWRKSPDGRLSIQVVAHNQREDISGLVRERLAKNSGEGIRESKLESTRTFSRSGVDWTEARIIATTANGKHAKEVARGTSGPGGTVLVFVHLVGAPEFEPLYDRLAEEILDSFHVGRAD